MRILLLTIVVISAESFNGKKYKTKEKTFKVEALDKSDPHVHVYYPIAEDASDAFGFTFSFTSMSWSSSNIGGKLIKPRLLFSST